jgi:hypothetical protein
VFLKQLSLKKAFRVTTMTVGIWNDNEKCCKVVDEWTIDDGIVEAVHQIGYYNPPPDFKDALLENVADALIDEAISLATQRNPLIASIVQTSMIIAQSLEDSAVPTPEFQDNTIFLGSEFIGYRNFVVLVPGEPKTSAVIYKGEEITKEWCDKQTSKVKKVDYTVYGSYKKP